MKRILIAFLTLLVSQAIADEMDCDFTSYDIDSVLVSFRTKSSYSVLEFTLFESTGLDRIMKYHVTIHDSLENDPFAGFPSPLEMKKQNSKIFKMRKTDLLLWDGALKALREGDGSFVTGGMTGSTVNITFQFWAKNQLEKEETYTCNGSDVFLQHYIKELKISNQTGDDNSVTSPPPLRASP